MWMLPNLLIIRTWQLGLGAATNSKSWCLAYFTAVLEIRALNCLQQIFYIHLNRFVYLFLKANVI